eukprot:TRINITY_DN39214_c0_g1_i2.p1 TRINITY_DN39214_c0_g1~~TRINITY_DN39214_c0_g1_i2.p1  ORF type:complete len:438 (+),score=72.39 TRINITY_DN39214_c0_g1_i2:158-1471(+)
MDDATANIADYKTVEIAGLSWAMAVLHARRNDLCSAIAEQTAGRLQSLAVRDLSGLAWAFVTMMHDDRPFIAELSGEAIRRAAKLPESDSPVAALSEAGIALTVVMWAAAVMGCTTASSIHKAESALKRLGECLDREGASSQQKTLSIAEKDVGHAEDIQSPSVVWESCHEVVVYKPSGWEVATADGRRQEAADSADRGSLTAYVCSLAASGSQPWSKILQDERHHYGLVHRLDVPSSGLVLVAKSYQAYYNLHLQLSTGKLAREYIVLAHAFMHPSRVELSTGMLGMDSEHETCRVAPQGRPTQTFFKVLGHFTRMGESFSLLAVKIRTGRLHQIRTHCAHMGHPTVTDYRYATPLTACCDGDWCCRNFLHRQRLAFQDGEKREQRITSRLPADLEFGMAQLTPKSLASATAYKSFKGDAPPRRWEDYAALRPPGK